MRICWPHHYVVRFFWCDVLKWNSDRAAKIAARSESHDSFSGAPTAYAAYALLFRFYLPTGDRFSGRDSKVQPDRKARRYLTLR